MSMNNVVHNTTWVPAHFHTTIAGPVFLAFIGMSLHLMTQLTGKQLRLPLVNLVVPYAWFGGMLVFSLPQSVVGLLGAPRRTDLGPTFANSASPLYEAHWVPLLQLGAIGAAIVGWAVFTGGDAAWIAAGIAVALLVLGAVIKFAVPHRRLRDVGVPTSTMVVGGILGIVGFFRILLWQRLGWYDYGEHHVLVALTVGCSLVGVVTFGSLAGSMLPFLLRRLGFDPASASAPFVATLVDVTGLIIYFTVAFLMLQRDLVRIEAACGSAGALRELQRALGGLRERVGVATVTRKERVAG